MTEPDYVEIIKLCRAQIIAAYKEMGSVEDVAKRFDIPEHLISNLVNSLALRESYRRKGSQIHYSLDYLKDCLREAAELVGEPLTIPKYREVAQVMMLPSDLTIVSRFGTFEEGCKQAGVKANPSAGPRSYAITSDQCIEALRKYKQMVGKVPTYDRYSRWATAMGEPSGSTVRAKLKTWGNALRTAFEN